MNDTVTDVEEYIVLDPITFEDELEQTEWSSPLLLSKIKKVYNDLVNIDSFPDNTLPKRENILRIFRILSPREVKVLIIGQDPYPNPYDACGFAFSFENSGRLPTPMSLRNILCELQNDGFKKTSGDLSGWVKQGVMLLNTSLTVEKHRSNSHKTIWEGFSKLVIDSIPNKFVAILWGNDARNFATQIRKKGGYCIESVHPSPLSASRGFFGSKPFSQCNKALAKFGERPIDWSL